MSFKREGALVKVRRKAGDDLSVSELRELRVFQSFSLHRGSRKKFQLMEACDPHILRLRAFLL